ncbi:MAG: 3-dehydroquinate synthase family protein [Phycisphaerales bacterium]
MSSPRTVHVELGDRGYDIVIGSGAIGSDALASTLKQMHTFGARRVFIVVDTGVPRAFVDQLNAVAESCGLKVTTSSVSPTEHIKSIETYQTLLSQIASTGHSRVDPVIGLGGGIVGDLAGFVAATYRRGVPLIQCPTTLLSMVDASVGGKTGFNLTIPNADSSTKLLKNLIGAFWQPKLVVADIATLDSLNERQRRSGISECIKHGCISAGVGHDGLLDWMREHMEQITKYDPSIMTQLVERNTALKASVVALDEHEDPSARAGGRMLLNFGHTFGHAIETIANLSPSQTDPALAPLHHGEAVGLGMIAACRAAQSHADLDPVVGDELVKMLNAVHLPIQVKGLPANTELIERMSHDKKATADSIRVILPTRRGHCTVEDSVSPEAIAAGFDAIRA